METSLISGILEVAPELRQVVSKSSVQETQTNLRKGEQVPGRQSSDDLGCKLGVELIRLCAFGEVDQ